MGKASSECDPQGPTGPRTPEELALGSLLHAAILKSLIFENTALQIM